ncbi:helix-turn-helix domain-containing protein [Terrabacter sp. GCM10028922]|uniref:helix-turn-helix domain-containing protein n=1 Tax=Terrabacter sp. GCM10028922 TaxID=3273428 RepID=UPI00360BEE46
MSDPVLGALGSELRSIREGLGISGVEAARLVGWSQPKISRVETGRFAPSLTEMASLLDFYGVPQDVRAELLARLAQREGVPGAWIVRAGGVRSRHASMGAIESRASRVRQYQAAVVPGLLQSAGYARAVAEAGGFSDVDGIVSRRMTRQADYFASPSEYSVVLSEAVLYPSVASDAVMEEQYEQLLRRNEDCDLRVLPLSPGVAVAPLVSFLIFDFDPVRSVVLIESQTADLYVSSPEDVSVYSELFARLQGAALDVEESSRRIRGLRRRSRAAKHEGVKRGGS